RRNACWNSARGCIAKLWLRRTRGGNAPLLSRAKNSGIQQVYFGGPAGQMQEKSVSVTIKPVSIAVVGSGYVGLVAAVCFAEIGHSVACVDNDEQKVAMLREGGVPIHEDFLPELLTRHRNQRLQFTTDLSAATRNAEAIFIAVGTPQS